MALVTGAALLSTPLTAGAEETSQAPAPAGAGVVTDIGLKLERDGRLSVTEQLTVPDGEVTRVVPLRQAAGDDVDRVYSVGAVGIEGPGRVETVEDRLVLHLGPGQVVLRYTVDGAVADVGDGQEVRWQVSGGWDTRVAGVSVSFIAPQPPRSITCLAGPVGSTRQCDLSQIGHTRIATAQQNDLAPGERIDFAVGVPAGTVPANARFEQVPSLTDAFALTPAGAAGFGGLTLLLVGGVVLLWYARGRDAQALASEVGPVEVLVTDEDGRVAFASPDGVLPGQVGTVADEHVDVVDISATVVDLAVRNYLWIEEVPGDGAADWRIVRRNAPDEHLTAYERAVYEALLHGAGPHARDEVLVSQLRGAGAPDLSAAREALYRDVVARNWFKRRPDTDRSRWWWIGVGLALAGVVATVLLTVFTGPALLGLAVMIGGVALAVGSRWMPARTGRGSALLAQIRGLRNYLHSVRPEQLPPADREMVFSRSLPYAVVLGETDRWLDAFAALDPAADGTPGLYWYGSARPGGVHEDRDLRRFARSFPVFLAALDGVLAEAGHLRSLRR